ncbi:MAG TPA: DUF92 domain-containing protein [Polyangia bacterium]|jgi:uncharacterized protein (TIGR00297 family)|nr:DUF92 domain-containing protein [Polyangia bacterium]
MDRVQSILLGLLLAAIVAWAARRRRSLTMDGSLAAAVVGTLVFGLGGLAPGLGLMGFFLTGTGLSRYRQAEKERRSQDVVAKGGERDALQVLSNGGAAALCCVLWAVTGAAAWALAAMASLAAAAADTWATEIGMLARRPPRHLLTFAEVPPGTSGAVSSAGLCGMVAGALFIGLIAALLPVSSAWGGAAGAARASVIGIVTLGGVAGALADSLLGATVQERRECQACGAKTEQITHRCGGATRRVAGVARLDNDMVNLLSTSLGGLIGALLWRVALG